MYTAIPIIISMATLLFSIYVYIINNNKVNTTELTTVIVKLENIGTGISDIKSEMSSIKTEQKEDHDKLISLESSVNTMWKRVDELRDTHNADMRAIHNANADI